ncbi:MAG: hypothetical protein QUS11_04740 [Candidatus Fermentibacter sp.]|nr:hypothetical protein [Candidatus Fermentibacter sp.]
MQKIITAAGTLPPLFPAIRPAAAQARTAAAPAEIDDRSLAATGPPSPAWKGRDRRNAQAGLLHA